MQSFPMPTVAKPWWVGGCFSGFFFVFFWGGVTHLQQTNHGGTGWVCLPSDSDRPERVKTTYGPVGGWVGVLLESWQN